MTDDRNEGVAPGFAGLMAKMLDTEVEMQTVHLRKRSGFGTVCGASGQVSQMPIGITCPECRKSKRVKR